MERMNVSLVFPQKDKQELYVNLDTPSQYNFVKFKNFKPRYLGFADTKVKVKYVGMGNIKGVIVVVVKLDDSKYTNVEQIGELREPGMFMEYEC